MQRTPDPPGILGTPKAATSGIPHPYAVAETSFAQMVFTGSREVFDAGGDISKVGVTGASQSVVISGESGAGKTESAKMVLAHLVARGGGGAALDNRLLETNPILEAFGNARTLRNPNSSRFGKLMLLHFKAKDKLARSYGLFGASIDTYLLERSRISFHGPGERNFHVFYLLLTGATDELRKELKCEEGVCGFRYTMVSDEEGGGVKPELSQPSEKDIAMDKANFEDLHKALPSIGVDGDDRMNLYRMIIAVLYLGNLDFKDEEAQEGDFAALMEEGKKALDVCGELLGIEPAELERVLVVREIVTRGEKILKKRNARGAAFARDAVAKSLYSKIFDWINYKIDVALMEGYEESPRNPTIGVLDIFGFESFQINGFEQLLINYTNEALQATFNRQVFIAEAALYRKEGLFGSDEYFGRPIDNSACVELLHGAADGSPPKGGLLMIMDSEGRTPEASDLKFNKTLHSTFQKHPSFLRPHPKDIQQTFIVRHYAGAVVYTVGTFLAKNNDQLPDEVNDLFATTKKPFVADVYKDRDESKVHVKDDNKKTSAAAPGKAAPKKPGPPGRKPPVRSVVRKFVHQIKELVDTLEATRCTFIRCVKPNPRMLRTAAKDWFDREYVTKQLHCLNVPQTAEVLKNGFPTRIEYAVLVDTYINVLPADALTFFKSSGGKDKANFVKALFYAFGVPSSTYKLGLTRVFFRSGELAALDKVLNGVEGGKVPKEIADRFKQFYTRGKWRSAIRKVLCCNRALRMYQSRRKGAVKMQSIVRARAHRVHFVKLRAGAIYCQKYYRGKRDRRKVEAMREKLLEEKRKREEELRRKMEQAKAEEAARLKEEAEQMQREREEAERKAADAKRKAEEEDKLKAERAAQALKDADAKAKREKENFMKKKRQSMAPTDLSGGFGDNSGARKTRALGLGKKVGTVALRSGGQLRRVSNLAPERRREVEEMKRKERLAKFRARVEAGAVDETKTTNEKLIQLERDKFAVPITGYMWWRNPKPGFFGLGKKWLEMYFVLNKDKRLLRRYTNADRDTKKDEYKLNATTKVLDVPGDKKKEHCFEVRDHYFGTVRCATLTKEEKEKWMFDIDKAILGFKATTNLLANDARPSSRTITDDFEDEPSFEEQQSDTFRQMYAARLRQEKIMQLRKLLNAGLISKKEFDETCGRIARAEHAEEMAAEGGGEGGDAQEDEEDYGVQVVCSRCGYVDNTAKKQSCPQCKQEFPRVRSTTMNSSSTRNITGKKGKKEKKKTDTTKTVGGDLNISLRDTGDGQVYLTFANGSSAAAAAPLKNPLCSLPYTKTGRFSCAMVGSERGMDFATFEEFVMYVVDCRFSPGPGVPEIGWTIARRFKQWRQLGAQLEGDDEHVSPLSAEARDKLPLFPKKGRWDNLRGVRSAAVVAEREQKLEAWLAGAFFWGGGVYVFFLLSLLCPCEPPAFLGQSNSHTHTHKHTHARAHAHRVVQAGTRGRE